VLSNALVVEVAKGTTHTTPPGLTSVNNNITYSLQPPKAAD
jgi:hypothetical protein